MTVQNTGSLLEIHICTIPITVVDPDPDPPGYAFIWLSSVPDTDPYWECGSGSRNIKIYQINLVFRFCAFTCMFFYLLPTLNILSCKKSTFCDLKVWPGSGSGSGSAWIRIGLASWNRIRIRIRIEIKKIAGSRSGSALKPMRIHNTDPNYFQITQPGSTVVPSHFCTNGGGRVLPSLARAEAEGHIEKLREVEAGTILLSRLSWIHSSLSLNMENVYWSKLGGPQTSSANGKSANLRNSIFLDLRTFRKCGNLRIYRWFADHISYTICGFAIFGPNLVLILIEHKLNSRSIDQYPCLLQAAIDSWLKIAS